MILNLKRKLSISRLKKHRIMPLFENQPFTTLWVGLRLIRKHMLSINKDKLSKVSMQLESSWRIACRKPFSWQFSYWYFHFWTYRSRNCYCRELLNLILGRNPLSFGRVLLQIFLTSISFNVKVLTNKNRKENGNMNNVKQNNTQVYRMTELLSSKPL